MTKKEKIDGAYPEGEFDVPSSSEALTAEEISEKYTVRELREILKENDLSVSGKPVCCRLKRTRTATPLPPQKSHNCFLYYIVWHKSEAATFAAVYRLKWEVAYNDEIP